MSLAGRTLTGSNGIGGPSPQAAPSGGPPAEDWCRSDAAILYPL